jgi:hypothetical protein
VYFSLFPMKRHGQRKRQHGAMYCAMVAVSAACDASTTINQMQVVASHNSYHVAPAAGVLTLMQSLSALGGVGSDPLDFNYTHPDLLTQAERQVRGFELDLFLDRGVMSSSGVTYSAYKMPAENPGHKYGHPAAISMASTYGYDTGPTFDPANMLSSSSVGELKVLHVPDLDVGTTCYTFKSCLAELKAWHDNNPSHHPMFINVSPVAYAPPSALVTVAYVLNPVPQFDTLAEMLQIETEILSVFSPDMLITPDQVQGSAPTLEAAVTGSSASGGWPTIDDSRGKFVFYLNSMRGSTPWSLYTSNGASLAGRSLFAFGTPGVDDITAFVKEHCCEALDSAARQQVVADWVQSGYIVRVRTDVFGSGKTTEQMRADADLAVASGAQILATDCFMSASGTCGDYTIALGATREEAYCSCTSVEPPSCYNATSAVLAATSTPTAGPTATGDNTDPIPVSSSSSSSSSSVLQAQVLIAALLVSCFLATSGPLPL